MLGNESGRCQENGDDRDAKALGDETLQDRVRSERSREIMVVEKTEECLRSRRLRWFGYLERMSEERAPLKATVDATKKEDKKRW